MHRAYGRDAASRRGLTWRDPCFANARVRQTVFDKEAVSATLGGAVEEILKDQPYDHSKVGLIALAARSLAGRAAAALCLQRPRARWAEGGGPAPREKATADIGGAGCGNVGGVQIGQFINDICERCTKELVRSVWFAALVCWGKGSECTKP